MMLRADDIHARIGPAWPTVLAQLGIPQEALRIKKAGPCPVCGGRDRYTFDNRLGRGDFICRHCGAGSGFDLLMRYNGWDFREARKRVIDAAGLRDREDDHRAVHHVDPLHQSQQAEQPAAPSRRVLQLLRESCALADCDDVVAYLDSRRLWPLPATCLRAHAAATYFDDGQRLGRFPALVAPVTDIDGELVSVHLTYLHHGRKLEPQEPRKLLSPVTGRAGCAVRLQPLTGDLLGIGEGIETSLAAARTHRMPVWSALNAALLAKFEPPPPVRRLLIFADRDTAGLDAAARLAERLQGRIEFQIKTPTAPAKDWADLLVQESS